MRKGNEITTIIKEKTDTIKYAYKNALNILDAYDHQTLTRPEGTYYDGDEISEEVAVDMLYDMIKNPIWYEFAKLQFTVPGGRHSVLERPLSDENSRPFLVKTPAIIGY